MKRGASRSIMPILRAYLESGSPDDNERNAGWIAEFIIEKATSGHVGYFKLLLELVDGKLRRTVEEEVSFETGCVLIVVRDERMHEDVRAA
jgi:hypothetical protein